MAGVQIDGVNNKIDFDDDQDTSISANTDDTLVFEVAGATDFTMTANTFTAESGSTIAAQALTATSITATGDISLDGGSFVFNESSADKDFRVESNGNTHMLFVDGGNNKVGIGESANAPMGTLHIKSADSGDTAIDANNDDLVVENDNHAGISICTPNDKAGGLYFSDPDDVASGRILHDHSTNSMTFTAGGLEFLRTDSSRKLSTGGEDTPDCDAGGLTIDINSNDGNSLTFKSSDVAHGITGSEETDTFFAIRKQSATNGGTNLRSYSERTDAEHFVANVQGADGVTTKSASATSNIMWVSSQKSGTGINAVGTDDNIFSIHNYINTQFIFDAEGTFHSNVGTATYDEYNDAHLVRAMDLSTSTKGLIASKFDEFIQYNHEDLANAKIVGREEDGTPNSMVNWTAMSQLHNGAIWQQYEKHQKLANAMYELAKAAVGEDKANEILEQNDITLLN